MSAVEPLSTPATTRRRSRRHLRPVTASPERAQPGVDLAGLSTQLAQLERDLRHTWTAMLELDAATAGRVSHAGKLLRQAKVVLADQSAIF
jgi:hypothetical protein